MGRIQFKIIAFAAIVVAIVIGGCTDGDDVANLSLHVDRASWSEASVQWQLKSEGELRNSEVVLYNMRHDTLSVANGSQITIPDGELGDEERLLVEVCGTVDGAQVCAQKGVRASPKRFAVRHLDLLYPLEPNFTRGRIEADVAIERPTFGNDDSWEVVESRTSPSTYLTAEVRGRNSVIEVPAHTGSRSFDFARLSGYDDFSFYLRSAMHDNSTANVQVDIFAKWKSMEQQIAEESFALTAPSEEERQGDLYFFAQQAAHQVIEHIFSEAESVSGAQVQVERWEYNRFDDQYTADIEIRWRESDGRGSAHILRGELSASQSGGQASFAADRATRHARTAWRETVGTSNEVLRLESLHTNLKRKAMERMNEEIDSDLPVIAER